MDECTTTAICAVNEHLSQIDAILKNAGFVRYLTASGDTGYDHYDVSLCGNSEYESQESGTSLATDHLIDIPIDPTISVPTDIEGTGNRMSIDHIIGTTANQGSTYQQLDNTTHASSTDTIALLSASAELTKPDPTMAGRIIPTKRTFSGATGLHVGININKKPMRAEFDPINQEIMRLRQENRHFYEVAAIINQQRIAQGKVPDLTSDACYGRYKRNAAMIAAVQGVEFKPCPLDLRPNKIKFHPAPSIAGFDPTEDRFLRRAHEEVQEEFWKLVSNRIVALGGKQHDPTTCAGRWLCL